MAIRICVRPIEIFIEAAPAFNLIVTNPLFAKFTLGGSAGFRYYFN